MCHTAAALRGTHHFAGGLAARLRECAGVQQVLSKDYGGFSDAVSAGGEEYTGRPGGVGGRICADGMI